MVLKVKGVRYLVLKLRGVFQTNAIVEGGKMDLSLYRFNGLDYPH